MVNKIFTQLFEVEYKANIAVFILPCSLRFINVLADIGHSVGTPGFEQERHEFTNQLMALFQKEVPDWTIKHTIRLLGIVAPEGYGIKPLRALALNPKWREETLSALVVMNTTQSRKLLMRLTKTGSVKERVEAIDMVRLVSGELSTTLLRSTHPEIRVAAMRGLAYQGRQDLMAPFEKALEGIDGTLRIEAVDAYLTLAENIELSKTSQR